MLSGTPILTAECHCESCRSAAVLLEALPGAVPHRAPTGGVPFVLWRKDRVEITAGADLLATLRLSPRARTRRLVARCCNTPMFLDFAAGHWISLYAARWPVETRPAPTLRTMTGDLGAARTALPDDMPNPKRHTAGFMLRLLAAWVAMGLRNPRLAPDAPELRHA